MFSRLGTKSLTVLLGVSLFGVAGYVIYTYLKQDDEDEFFGNLPNSSKFKVSELRIPKEYCRLIIGRNGKKIKEIQDQSCTVLKFKEVDDKTTICLIRGTVEGCYLAEHIITDIISQQPILEVEEIWVPQKVVGKIIGRCGENIREIIDMTGAQISVNSDDRKTKARKVVIKGSKDQILLAKSYIDEIIETYEHNQTRIESTISKREPRLPPKNSDAAKTPTESPRSERISPILGQSDNPFEVYVSAMVDPSRFWVQIFGSKATELDLLVEEMTEYYNKPSNKELHILQKVQQGDLVAATFQYDNKWYRAEVLNVLSGNVSEPQAELYYVDYGDTDTVTCKELYELRTDFLRLHFQAIECFLAKIEPSDNQWTEEAVDKFEEWTHVAQWQKLSAKLNGYSVREKTRAKREGSPVPGLELFDVNNEKDIDIAEEMVKHGYAVYKKESTSRSPSVSNVSVD